MARVSRDPEKTRARILEVAFEEVYARGFQGVGVREIAAKANLTIGAFFHYFPTKNSIGYAILDEIIRQGILERWVRPLVAYKNPVTGILKTYKKVFDEWPDEYVSRGCPLNNLTQEMAAVDPGFHERTQRVILDWVEETRKHLERGKRSGYVKEATNVRELAQFIVTLQEATFAMGKALNDRTIYESLYRSLSAHLKAVSAAPE